MNEQLAAALVSKTEKSRGTEATEARNIGVPVSVHVMSAQTAGGADDKISRAVERVRFAQQVLQLADSLDENESLAKEVREAVDSDQGVHVSSFSKNADLLYRLAQDGLRHNNDNHIRVGDCLERLTNETYSYESRGDALDHLYRTSAGKWSSKAVAQSQCPTTHGVYSHGATRE